MVGRSITKTSLAEGFPSGQRTSSSCASSSTKNCASTRTLRLVTLWADAIVNANEARVIFGRVSGDWDLALRHAKIAFDAARKSEILLDAAELAITTIDLLQKGEPPTSG